MDDSTILETQDLRKAFGGLVAVAGVSMKVQAHTCLLYTSKLAHRADRPRWISIHR